MPKLTTAKQSARREHILDAAERCFVERGFHTTTMQDICEDAAISPGTLYTYFSSKDDLIIGLCEREMDRFDNDLEEVAAAPDLFVALRALCEHYSCNEPIAKVRLQIEIGAEAARNPAIRRKVNAINESIRQRFIDLLEREQAVGRIEPQFPLQIVVRVMAAIGDGLFMSRAVEPDFDPKPVIPAVMAILSALVKPVEGSVR